MTSPAFRPAIVGVTVAFLALAGCGADPRPQSAGHMPPPKGEGPAARDDLARARTLLADGKADKARKVLDRILKTQPGDAAAGKLRRQIDVDPVQLLGAGSFAYTVKAGEGLEALAGRFLGDPALFYALGRYNGLAFPVTLAEGQPLRIPGVVKAARPKPAAERARPVAPPAAPPPPKAAIARSAAPPAGDPARAARLRGAALEQLNRGAVDRAVALLRQANAAAPGNPLVQRDLQRALRIRHTVAR